MTRKKSKPSSRLSQKALRRARDEGELYALITKIYGGGRCEVGATDGSSYICIIRNKFRGRGKRDNLVKVSGIVLVGKREWERPKKGKLGTVDLLYVYGDGEKKELERLFPSEVATLKKVDPNQTIDTANKDDVFTFEEEDGAVEEEENEENPDTSELEAATACSGSIIEIDDI